MFVMISHLPIDLIRHIFSKLPAKTVARLKIVCKSWYHLIDDDYFVDYHLEQSLATHSNLHFVVTVPRFYMQKLDHLPEPIRSAFNIHYSADFDSLDNLRELSHPFKDRSPSTRIYGSCRGLLLLHLDDGHLLLYNPTTQTYSTLPVLHVFQPAKSYGQFDYGFGYVSGLRDYKCVRIMQCFFEDTGSFVCEVMVYSFETDTWKRVPDVPFFFRTCARIFGILVHEVLHWVGTNSDNVFDVVVAFSLRDETFSCLQFPNFEFQPFQVSVGMLDGCLCLQANRYPECDIWVMKEYGVVGSWTKMFTFSILDRLFLERPISYSMDKKRLLVRILLSKLVYLDLETTEHTQLTFADWSQHLDAHVFVENLLMLDYSEFADDIDI